jgi:hypothetical protein
VGAIVAHRLSVAAYAVWKNRPATQLAVHGLEDDELY